jgi:hypothetical protein
MRKPQLKHAMFTFAQVVRRMGNDLELRREGKFWELFVHEREWRAEYDENDVETGGDYEDCAYPVASFRIDQNGSIRSIGEEEFPGRTVFEQLVLIVDKLTNNSREFANIHVDLRPNKAMIDVTLVGIWHFADEMPPENRKVPLATFTYDPERNLLLYRA